jgi:hypothetical protein
MAAFSPHQNGFHKVVVGMKTFRFMPSFFRMMHPQRQISALPPSAHRENCIRILHTA